MGDDHIKALGSEKFAQTVTDQLYHHQKKFCQTIRIISVVNNVDAFEAFGRATTFGIDSSGHGPNRHAGPCQPSSLMKEHLLGTASRLL